MRGGAQVSSGLSALRHPSLEIIDPSFPWSSARLPSFTSLPPIESQSQPDSHFGQDQETVGPASKGTGDPLTFQKDLGLSDHSLASMEFPEAPFRDRLAHAQALSWTALGRPWVPTEDLDLLPSPHTSATGGLHLGGFWKLHMWEVEVQAVGCAVTIVLVPVLQKSEQGCCILLLALASRDVAGIKRGP